MFSNNILRCILILVILLSCFGIYNSLFFGILVLLPFLMGCALSLMLIKYKDNATFFLGQLQSKFTSSEDTEVDVLKCNICEDRGCRRHKTYEISREPWKGLLLNKDLDSAVDSFYSKILDCFIKSWFSVLSSDCNFVYSLKQGLREVTCHLINRFKMINFTNILTNNLLPMLLNHVETVKNMLDTGMTMNKLPNGFIQNENQIHPAVINRLAELSYLRAVAKYLIIKIFHKENYHSKIFFSLIRELVACWILLPFLDVISDPNLINLMVISAFKKKSIMNRYEEGNVKVEFLKKFVQQENEKTQQQQQHIIQMLNDRTQLYSFMQFLKKEGAVDVLRFYMDVDDLNKELQDPKITTDPAKLSSLYKQSEKLLEDYQTLVLDNESLTSASSLSQAHERIGNCLKGKWEKIFHETPEYFKLIYGSREMNSTDQIKNLAQVGTASRIGSKLKDVIRGAINGAPLEATEVPTVWDGFVEPQASNVNQTIYSSVTQKLRKERGQNLEAFLIVFMQSLEQRADIGEDVVELTNIVTRHLQSPGRNLVFNNLFGVMRPSNIVPVQGVISYNINGPSECLLYILYKVITAPLVVVRIMSSFICISKKAMDIILCEIIERIIKLTLYRGRLPGLIKSFEHHIFGPKNPEPCSVELLERQKQARFILEQFRSGTGTFLDVLQSPALNKHLMYCAFDTILIELYPELRNL